MVSSMIGTDIKLSATFKGEFLHTEICQEDDCDGSCGCNKDIYEDDIIMALSSSSCDEDTIYFINRCNDYGVDRLLDVIVIDSFNTIFTWDSCDGFNRYNKGKLESILRDANKLNVAVAT